MKRENVISFEEGLRLDEELEEELTGLRRPGARSGREGADSILMQGLTSRTARKGESQLAGEILIDTRTAANRPV